MDWREACSFFSLHACADRNTFFVRPVHCLLHTRADPSTRFSLSGLLGSGPFLGLYTDFVMSNAVSCDLDLIIDSRPSHRLHLTRMRATMLAAHIRLQLHACSTNPVSVVQQYFRIVAVNLYTVLSNELTHVLRHVNPFPPPHAPFDSRSGSTCRARTVPWDVHIPRPMQHFALPLPS